jgi:uncharacterized protein with HEPN domain
MQLEVRKLLFDVQSAGRLIGQFTRDRSFDDYSVDALLRSAVELQFEIIGEALNKLSKLSPSMISQVPHYRRVIAFRNILVHNYDAVEEEVVWGVIESNLPGLLQKVEELLETPEPR